MSHRIPDPAQNPQFRRNWGAERPVIKFLTELGEQDIDHLAIAQGERTVRRLPEALVAGFNLDERRDLAARLAGRRCADCASSGGCRRRHGISAQHTAVHRFAAGTPAKRRSLNQLSQDIGAAVDVGPQTTSGRRH